MSRIKEVIILTRPNKDILFHSPSSTMYFENTDPTECESNKYFLKKYVETGKAEIVPVGKPDGTRLSDDGLSIIYVTIFNNITYLEEAYSDTYWIENDDRIGTAWRLAHDFKVRKYYYLIE